MGVCVYIYMNICVCVCVFRLHCIYSSVIFLCVYSQEMLSKIFFFVANKG